MTELPHFPQPFKFHPKGAAVVEQGSSDDISDCVFRTALCPEGYRDDEPEFGIPELAFATPPLPLQVLQECLQRWEPRASLTLDETASILNAAERSINVEVEA